MTIHAKYTPAWLIIKSMSQFRSILLAACSKRPEQQQTALTFRREKKHIFRTDVGFSWWVPIASSTHQYLQLHEHSYTHTHTHKLPNIHSLTFSTSSEKGRRNQKCIAMTELVSLGTLRDRHQFSAAEQLYDLPSTDSCWTQFTFHLSKAHTRSKKYN